MSILSTLKRYVAPWFGYTGASNAGGITQTPTEPSADTPRPEPDGMTQAPTTNEGRGYVLPLCRERMPTRVEELVAIGINNCWKHLPLYISWRDFFNMVVKSGANAVFIDTYGCYQFPHGQPMDGYQGYWHNHQLEVFAALTPLLTAAQDANVAVIADLSGANYKRGENGQNIESPELDDAWFLRTLRFYKARGPSGLFLSPMSEPRLGGTLSEAGWRKYLRWRDAMRREWVEELGGVALQNEDGGCPTYDVPGFTREEHPPTLSFGHIPGTLSKWDSGLLPELYTGDIWRDPQINADNVRYVVQETRRAGAGAAEYWPGFEADKRLRQADMDVIGKAV